MRQQTTKREASKREAKPSTSRGKDEAGAKILPLRQASATVSEVKAEVYRLADTGLSSYQIAPLVGKSPATIQRWLKDRPEKQQTTASEATREANEPAM